MEGIQIIGVVIFLAGLVAVDVAAMRRGFDSRFRMDCKYDNSRPW